ncbi:hypothetical protein RO3G_01764 [Rhizopus delemar RA 99-880]|uniref:Uncharacterized protein n=1 Tax=Rhizopus delemar (strain RA 99-880 / ATCC MYA-4621 / FGSC 9543 / NRRL 43880) TaxID=246409 RepID=I1BLI0_RHIO9|nr:hypothetical protein RO3G_01764 [Rhizopus delemar RA 99-880]|eukprot:EIE77060.1 hypothetical protein RO3G_01764 [Rhizopus delemar RA 99-880]
MSSTFSFRNSVVSWDKDVKYALNRSGLSSSQVLMNWLTVPTNFYSYVNPKKKSKEAVLIDITQYFRDKGISYRQSKSIRTQLLKLCREYDQIKPLYGASVDPGWPSQDEDIENVRCTMNLDDDEEVMEQGNTEHNDLISVADVNNTDDELGTLHDVSQSTEEANGKEFRLMQQEFEWRQSMKSQMLALKRSKLAIKKNVAIIDHLKHMFQQGFISREQYKEMTLEAFDGLRNA